MNADTDRARAAWIRSLSRHRRGWPEWAELERRVRERELVRESIAPSGASFLVSRAVPPLTRRIGSDRTPIPPVASPFPPWVSAIVGVGNAANPVSAGAIASLWPPNKLRPLTPASWSDQSTHEPPSDLAARAVFVLQTNRSGTPIYSDGTTVFGFAPETGRLTAIGELEPFLRFCLRHVLAGQDWFAAWEAGDGEGDSLARVELF